MNEVVDRLLEPGLWFLASWSCRWAAILSLVWAWLKLLPPRRASVRHAVCLTTLLVGLSLPLMPKWQLAVWLPARPHPAERGVAKASLDERIQPGSFAESLTVPDELPPEGRESVAKPARTRADQSVAEETRRSVVTAPPRSPPPAVKTPFGARRYLVLVLSVSWAIAVLIGFGRLAFGLAGVHRLQRESVELEGLSNELLADCRARIRTKRVVRLASHPVVSSPLAVGLARPVILVPEDWHSLPPASRRASLMHEIQHLASYDDWVSLWRAGVGVLFFFHPLVHWLLWRIGHESELICDDAALATGIGERDYGRLLLEFAQRPTIFPYRWLSRAACSVPFGNRRTIKKRLLRLLDPERPWALAEVSFRRRLLLTVACFGLGGAMSGISLKAAPQAADPPQEAVEAPAARADDVAARPAGESAAEPAAAAERQAATRTARKRTRKENALAPHELKPMPISVQGTVKDQEDQPLPGVTVYVARANDISAFGEDPILARTTTDDAGRYALTDVVLPVRTFPPKPDVAEGKFQVFGVSDGRGFTWHGVRAYRPRPRPEGDVEPNMDRAYYEGEVITNDLQFGPTEDVAGQVLDDLGNAVAGAKVQIGVIDDRRRPGSTMYRFELITPADAPADSDRTFTSIPSLPESLLFARTDADGRYRIRHVPRDATFVALVSATPDLASRSATVTTSDTAINGAVSAIGGGWNPVLVAPRTVTVHAVDQTSKKPLDGVLLHAYGNQIRLAGNEARSDAEGRAVLRLSPGHYRLVAEPAHGSLYLRTEQEIDVAEERISQTIEFGVQGGARVVLEATTADSRPVEGVTFAYEKDTSRDRQELQSQTVFVDHPRTGGDGVLRAVVEPGRRRFFVSTVPDGYEAAEVESPWTELLAGGETTLAFELRRKAEQEDATEVPAEGDDLQLRLQTLWLRQNELQFKGRITYRMTHRSAGEYVVTRDEIRDAVSAFDPKGGTDIASWINQHLPELDVRLMGPYQMVVDGPRHRRDKIGSYSQEATSTEVFNGDEIIRYDAGNAQVSVDDRRVSFVHIDGVDDLRLWPRVARPIARQPIFNVVSRAGGRVVLGSGPDELNDRRPMTSRLVVDEATGFIYENSYYQRPVDHGRDEFQFDPIELPGGMIWPRLRVSLSYRRGEIYTIGIHEISSIEPQSELPADAFVVALPPGTLVLASDFGAAVSDRKHEQRVGPKQGMATGPVTDAVQFAYSLSPRTRSLWPVLKVGEVAPALNAVAWLTTEGKIEAPNLDHKVVLVNFWGQSCFFCVAEFPKLVNLAKQYAKTDLQIVGWHERRGDVDGVAQFARKHGLPYTLAIDHEADEPGWFGALFKSFGVRAIPQSALLDREGRVAFVGSLNEAITRLDDVLAAKGRN